VFTNLLLADEINRASPKTQAALLEAMQERRVTTFGETRALPNPFFVLATQNPIELEGTYPLPEAQLDRFTFKVEISGVERSVLEEILVTRIHGVPPALEPVINASELQELFTLVDAVFLPRASCKLHCAACSSDTSEITGSSGTRAQFCESTELTSWSDRHWRGRSRPGTAARKTQCGFR
jgi:MoxR-like ATPase